MAATPRVPLVNADMLPLLPESLATSIEPHSEERLGETVPMDIGYAAIKTFLKDFEGLANVQYANEPLQMPELVAANGDVEVRGNVLRYFGSTPSALIGIARHAHTVIVQLIGTNYVVRAYHLEQFPQATALMTALWEASKPLGLHLVPRATLTAELEPEEQAMYAKIKPDFSFTPAEVAGISPSDILVNILGSTNNVRASYIFWSIGARGTTAEIRVWVMARAGAGKQEEKQQQQQCIAPAPPAPRPTVVTAVVKQETPAPPPQPVGLALFASVKKRRADDSTVTM